MITPFDANKQYGRLTFNTIASRHGCWLICFSLGGVSIDQERCQGGIEGKIIQQ
jgi:hypothetical protein